MQHMEADKLFTGVLGRGVEDSTNKSGTNEQNQTTHDPDDKARERIKATNKPHFR